MTEETIHFEKERKTLDSFLAHVADLAVKTILGKEGTLTINNRQALEELLVKVDELLKTEKNEDQIKLLKHVKRHVKYALTGEVKKRKTEVEELSEGIPLPKPKKKKKGKKAETEAVETPPPPPSDVMTQ